MERGGQEGTRKNNGRLLYSDLIYIYNNEDTTKYERNK